MWTHVQIFARFCRVFARFVQVFANFVHLGLQSRNRQPASPPRFVTYRSGNGTVSKLSRLEHEGLADVSALPLL